jgi:hypothetical protein
VTSHPRDGIQRTTGSWITSVVFHDDGPATYAVHKKETAPDLIADFIQDEKTATLIAAAPDLLAILEDIRLAYCGMLVGLHADPDWSDLNKRAIGAITKAKGE